MFLHVRVKNIKTLSPELNGPLEDLEEQNRCVFTHFGSPEAASGLQKQSRVNPKLNGPLGDLRQ
jgi:hypothetical protein